MPRALAHGVYTRGLWAGRTCRTCKCRRRYRPRTAPDQHHPLLIGRETLTGDEFNLEILKRLVIELELPLERTISQAAPLA